MKALSAKQPWANLIAAGEKTIETRTWATRYRGPLLIVSSRRPRIEPVRRLSSGSPLAGLSPCPDGAGVMAGVAGVEYVDREALFAPGAGHRRGELRGGARRCRPRPQQLSPAASRHQPPGRGRVSCCGRRKVPVHPRSWFDDRWHSGRGNEGGLRRSPKTAVFSCADWNRRRLRSPGPPAFGPLRD